MKKINDLEFYSVPEYDFSPIREIARVKKRGKRGKTYVNTVAAFDIETSGIKEIEHSFMYVWSASIFGDVIIGRTWSDFRKLCYAIKLQLEENETFVFYVHNLSYEMSFLKGIYGFDSDSCFCTMPRKFLKSEIMDGAIEFRCSYLHSNMNLSMFTDKFQAKHKKLSGDEFDYDALRYPWTPLTDEQLLYCGHDVVGLCEALENEMRIDGDNIATIPLTSTGYVRRDVKNAMRTFSRDWLHDLLPDYDTYLMLRDAFRGGDTHANRLYAGKIIEDVVSFDVASSYPAQQLLELYPMGRFYKYEDATIEDVEELKREGNAVLFEACFTKLRLKRLSEPNPYFSYHKMNECVDFALDNGRVLSCEYCEATLTDVDWEIVKDTYAWDSLEIKKCKFSHYGKLPKQIRATIMEYFRLKTELKGDSEKELLYMKSKNKLNSIYGMTATLPVRRSVIFDGCTFSFEEINEEEELYRYNKNAFLSYAWGVWCTAWARYLLHLGIRCAGGYAIYWDTDSVKFVNRESVKENFEALNKIQLEKADKENAFVEFNGKRFYMGFFEFDGAYQKFKTLGAKKYCYVDTEGNLKITVAGVGKKKGAKELSSIEDFKIGKVFHDGGGNESVYNDGVKIEIEREGKKILITDNIYIKPSVYTLGVTGEYFDLIRGSVSDVEAI